MDAARWLLGVKYPTKVSAIGGHFMFDDERTSGVSSVSSTDYSNIHGLRDLQTGKSP